jgi:hypothetical protein
MPAMVVEMEATLHKASSFVMDLSAYVSTLPTSQGPTSSSVTVPMEDFLAFKVAHAQSLASIWQDLKGGAIKIGGVTFDGKDACVTFAREHMMREPTYHCFPSLMFAMCMPSEEVIYKSNMQGGEIHMARTLRNPMQSAVILSVNSTIPAMLEGPKDSIHEAKHDFNAARMYEDWMPVGMLGGTSKNIFNGIRCTFERIKVAINLTLGAPLAKAVMLELHGELLMHFGTIFTMEVTSYYQDILGKTGGPPPHDKEVKVSCWALVTKLLKIIFREIHKVRMFAAELGNTQEDPARGNGLLLYSALKELRVLRNFHTHEYHCHPKYNQCVVLHLFDTSLPRAVYEKCANGPGQDIQKFNNLALNEQMTSLNCLETVVGSIRSHLQLLAQGVGNRCQGEGANGAGDARGVGVEKIE